MKLLTYALALALLGSILTNCTTHNRLQAERLAHQTSKAQYAEQVATAERQRSDEEAKRRKAETELNHAQEAHGEEVAALRVDADRARHRAAVESGRVRDAAATAAARARAQCADQAAADLGTPAGDPIGVLADVLGRADARAGELADLADRRYIAGLACEREYDAARKALTEN